MKAYAFPVEPDDIYEVLVELRKIGAKWGIDRDPVEYFESHIVSDQILGEGIALYIKEEKDIKSGNTYYGIEYSRKSYIYDGFVRDYGSRAREYAIVDSFYSIQEFQTTDYPELVDNEINFFDI